MAGSIRPILPSLHRNCATVESSASASGDSSLTALGNDDVGEAPGGVTAFAIFTKSAAVDVIAAVTGDAPGRQLARIARADMAGRADKPLVPSGQLIVGLAVVIEAPDLPVSAVVAAAALRRGAERTLVMLVIMTVSTGDALGGEGLVGMASDALHLRVLAEQRKARQIVVKTDLRLPVGAVMAPAAGLAELALVNILRRVA